MSARPWMAFYPADYMADTVDLTTEEHGFYLLLLMIAWRRNGPIPDDMGALKRSMSACASDMHGRRFNRLVGRVLARFFVRGEDGNWRHKRLEKELEIVRNFSEKQSKNAEKRWTKEKEIKVLEDAKAMPARASSQPQSHPQESPPSEIITNDDDTGAPNVVEFPKDGHPRTYAFEAGAIKLNQRDLDNWRKAFPHIPLEADLWSLSEWAASQGKRWFHAVASALAKREREAVERLALSNSEGRRRDRSF